MSYPAVTRPYQPRAPHFQQGPGMQSNAPMPQYGVGNNAGQRPPPPGPTGPDQADLDAYNAKMYEWRQDLDAKRLRKSIYRKTVDYFTPVVKYLEERSVFVEPSNFRDILADPLYYSEMLSPVAYPHNASNAITTKFIRQATNKIKCPVFVTLWTPDGRRLVTGSSSGEFTLWNGLTFNFETILQAHDSPIRSMVWSRSDTWLVTGDATGYIKYWQANMNNVKSYQAHRDSIRGITFCPTDFKFATGSDDGTIRIWDFDTCETIKVLRGGHGGEVKCVDWHPKKSLLVTGSRDNQQPVKLWDPRTADSIGTLYLHKGPVTDLKWNPINSNYLLSSSRDTLVKLFDLRTMKDFQTCRGHKREVMSVAWHPIYQSHFCSGGIDGSLMFWSVGTDREVGFVDNAHDGSIWSMSWHPQGHILVTGSNDCSVKFWTRNRPGDPMKDKYNVKARGDTDSTLDLNRSEMQYEYEEEEEEVLVDSSRVDFDSQDISEFESNAPRPLRAPGVPPPQFSLQQGPPPQQYGQRPPSQAPAANFQSQPRGFEEHVGPRFPFRSDPNQQQYESRDGHNMAPHGDFQDRRTGDNQYRTGGAFYNHPPADKTSWNQPKPGNQQLVGQWDNRQSHGFQANATGQNRDEWRDSSRLQYQGPYQREKWAETSQSNNQNEALMPEGGRSSSVVLLPTPPSGQQTLLPAPPAGQQTLLPNPHNPPDYRRGDKRQWEQSYDDRYQPQGDDRREGESGQEGFSGATQGDRRDFRPRATDRGGRGPRRAGPWRGARY